MSDGDFGGYSGGNGPVGRIWSIVLAVLMLVAAGVVLISSDGRQWLIALMFVGFAIFFPLMGWVIEPRAREWSKRLPWRRL